MKRMQPTPRTRARHVRSAPGSRARHTGRPWLLALGVWLGAVPAALAQAPAPEATVEVAPKPEDEDEDVEAATAHFQRGVTLFQRGAYRAALIEFRRAYDTVPNYRVLYNIGQTHQVLHEHLEATRAFEHYLIDGAADIPEERRQEVEGTIRSLEEFVAVVAVNSNVRGATVYIDDTAVGTTPLPRAVAVNLGRHRVSVASKDGRTTSQLVDLAGGDVVEVELVLEKPTTGKVAAKPAPMGTARRAAYGTLGTTAMLAAGTLAAALMQTRAQDEFERELGRIPGGDRQDIRDQRDKAETFALVTDVLGLATATALVASTVLFLVSRKQNWDETPTAHRPRWTGSVDVGPERAGFVTRLRF